MNKQLGCIVAMAIFGMIALVAMAGYGTSKNPRLWLKGSIEGQLPVVWKEYELADGSAPWERRLVVRVAARPGEAGAAPGRELADRVALATVDALKNQDAPKLDFTTVTVELEGAPPLTAGRYELERRLVLDRANERVKPVVVPRRPQAQTSTAK